MVLKQKFRKTPEFIVTYAYIDVANGTGVERFYGFVNEDSVGVDYSLTNKVTVLSSIIDKSFGTTDGGFTLKADYDFDLTAFNTKRTIQGTAVINLPLRCGGTGGGAWMSNAYVIIKIRKVDAITGEAEIASVQSPTLVPAASDESKTMCLTVAIPKTNFNRGDVLRMTVELWALRVGGGAKGVVFAAIAHDPANRDGNFFTAATNPTQTVIDMPFALNI